MKFVKEYGIHRFVKGKDIVTLLNAAFGFAAIISILQGNFMYASIFLVLAVIADVLDGLVARKFSTPTKFGKFLDAADLISFGVAPALFLIAWLGSLDTPTGISIYIVSFALLLCGLLRLARFFSIKADIKIGMPITANGIIIPALYFLGLSAPGIIVLIIIDCILMTSDLQWL